MVKYGFYTIPELKQGTMIDKLERMEIFGKFHIK